MTNIAPFELKFSRTPKSIALQSQPTLEGSASAKRYHLRGTSWFKSLMISTSKQSIDIEQALCKLNYDSRVRKPLYEIPGASFVFLSKETSSTKVKQHKLSPMATDPISVVEVRDDSVVIEDGEAQARVSRDRMELAPKPLEYINRSATPNDKSP